MPLRYGVDVLPPPWTVPVDPLLVAAVAASAWTLGWSAARRGEAATRRRRGLTAAAGIFLLAATWVSPLETLGAHYLLTAHLAQITLVMGVIPPLLLLALPEHAPRVGPWLGRLGRTVTHPAVAMVAINLVFFLWHLGPVYEAGIRTPELYPLEQVSLLAVSVLFWWPIVAPFGRERVLSRWSTLGYILVATIPQTFAGITLALARHELYPTYALAPRLLGLSVMTDQQIAGACLALVSKLALFTAFGVIFMRLLNESPADEGDDGGGGWRRPGADTPSPQPSGTLGWLADLNAGRTVPEPVAARATLSSPAGAGSRRE